MLHKTKLSTLIILLVSSFSLSCFVSCTEPIDLDLNTTHSRMVIEGRITDDFKKHQVKVSRTSDYFANQPTKGLIGALVSITDENNNKIDLLDGAIEGVYETQKMSFIPGKTYRLEVYYNNKKYIASAFMPPVAKLDSVGYKWSKSHDHYHALINTQETPGESNFYEWQVYLNSYLVNDSLFETTYTDDQFVDGSYISNIQIFSFSDFETGDTLMVEQYSLTREAYEFYTAATLETKERGGLFDGPPANIPSNISNGALGFFMASSVSRNHVISR